MENYGKCFFNFYEPKTRFFKTYFQIHILKFRFFKNLGIFSHKHYFKLMNAIFFDTTRRDLYNNEENFTLKAIFENF